MVVMETQICGKPIQFYGSADWNSKYGGLEAALYSRLAIQVLREFPFDMLVFEMADQGKLQIRLAGYHLLKNTLDEETVVLKTSSLHIETFWLKLDDYGDKWIATFLFPSDY